MRQFRAGLDRIRPTAVVLSGLALFLYLMLWDGQKTFPLTTHMHSDFISSLVEYGFSACVAFTYLAVGLVVWLYVRDRLVGRLLLAFTLCVMVVFTLETADIYSNNLAVSLIDTYTSLLSFYLGVVLLLVFPHNYLAKRPGKGGKGGMRAYLPHVSLVLLTGGLVYDMAIEPATTLLRQLVFQQPVGAIAPGNYWLPLLYLCLSLGLLPLTYRRAGATARERQQVRIVGIGMLLAYLPFLVGTVLPLFLTQGGSEIPAEFTTVFFILVPLSLGYAVLRYHVLLVDRYIRSAVTLLVGGVFLAVGAYLVFFFSGILLPANRPMQVWGAAGACLLVLAAVWRAAPWLSNRLFAPDLAAAHRLMYGEGQPPEPMKGDADPIEAVARLLMQSAQSVLGAQQVSFLAFHRESDAYRPVSLRADVVGNLLGSPSPLLPLLQALQADGAARRGWLDAREPLFVRLAGADRPLLLSEARFPADQRRRARVLASPVEEDNPLLVPLKTGKGALIGCELAGVLVLGARDNALPYAGPDLALIDLLLGRFSWLLEAALMEAQTRQHVAMLNTLSAHPAAPALPGERTVEELSRAYTEIVASAMGARAEIWLYQEREALLRQVAHAGAGPFLRQARSLAPGEEGDWASWFYEGGGERWADEGEQARPGVLDAPDSPCAWLPLLHRGLPVGVLVLTYPHLHHLFSPAERQILELFAHQLATALESARLAGKLRTDAASQRERARFKGQELLVQLRYLLQPLVSAQRYLGLLREQGGPVVPPEECTGLPTAQEEEAPHAVESLAPALSEILARLVTSTRESLSHLQTLASSPEGDTDPEAIADRVRSQVNAILREFDDERQTEVLVVTADGGLGAMLVSALSLNGYSPSLVPSCQEAVVEVRQRLLQEAEPSVLILDSAALRGGSDLIDFTGELKAAWPFSSSAQRLPPLLLISAENPGGAHLPEQQTLEAPFSVHAFLERVQACIANSPGAGA